jgi:hypothetical protein
MRINLGIEDFLSEEQKYSLLDLQKLVLKEGWLEREHGSQLSDEEQYEQIVICFDVARSILNDAAPGLEMVRPGWEDARSEQHESAECVDENKAEANDITNIIHSSCKNREE